MLQLLPLCVLPGPCSGGGPARVCATHDAVPRCSAFTPNRAAFRAGDTVPAAGAPRSARRAQTAASTKVPYAAVVPLYEGACATNGIAAWPLSRSALGLFAGYPELVRRSRSWSLVGGHGRRVPPPPGSGWPLWAPSSPWPGSAPP